jgi:hypothetical protein
VRTKAIFILVLISGIAFSQGGFLNKKNWYLKPAINYGFIVPHRATISHLITGYVPMMELNIVKPSGGDCLWQRENNNPDYGINLTYINFGNPKILGECFAISPFIEIPLNKVEKPSRVIFRINWGLAYVTKRFDIENNHKNIAIGSHWNVLVQYRFHWNLKLGERYRLEPGISLSHVSNCRAQVPNLGLNMISLNLGLTYKVKETKCDVTKIDSSSKAPARHEALFWYGFGINENDPPGSTKFKAHTLSFNYFFNKRNTHKFGVGADLYYEEIFLSDLDQLNIPHRTFSDEIRAGIKFAYSYNVGHISFPIEMGHYVYSIALPDGGFFHRFGIRYTGSKGLMVHFSMKSHWAVAYHFEVGGGYRLPLKKRNRVKG